MLRYGVVEGWEPLCQFLGEEVPREPFPKINDANSFVFVHRVMWWLAFSKMMAKVGLMASPALVAAGATAWWQGGLQKFNIFF